jgi:hypothetical protein
MKRGIDLGASKDPGIALEMCALVREPVRGGARDGPSGSADRDRGVRRAPCRAIDRTMNSHEGYAATSDLIGCTMSSTVP